MLFRCAVVIIMHWKMQSLLLLYIIVLLLKHSESSGRMHYLPINRDSATSQKFKKEEPHLHGSVSETIQFSVLTQVEMLSKAIFN